MISIILRNRNEAQYIGFALQSIVDLELNAQVIVVDNDSTDESLSIVGLFRNILDIEVLRISDYTPGRALNQGIDRCKYETVLVMSAHLQLISFNFNKLKELLKTYDAVMGKQIPIYLGKKITPRYIWSHFGEMPSENLFSEIENRPFLHNALCAYSKKTLQKLPFDEKLAGKEDRYWAIMLIEKGGKYFYTPELEGNHFYTQNGATWKGLA